MTAQAWHRDAGWGRVATPAPSHFYPGGLAKLLLFGAARVSFQALHEVAGGVHMDMKPQQLLVDDFGRGKVNDFNSVHIMSSRRDVEGEFCPVRSSKPQRVIPWRAPENLAGKVRKQSSV